MDQKSASVTMSATIVAPADVVSNNVLADLQRSTGEAYGLPGALYSSESFEVERQVIFAQRWVPVANALDVANPGDVHPLDVAGWQLLLVRTRDGAIKCFHNICRHRGMKLVAEPAVGRRAIQCPWHSWTYDLSGRLIATPRLGGIDVNTAPGFDCAQLSLMEVRCEQWLDFVYVNIDGRAGPFDRFISPLAERFAGYDFDSLTCIGKVETIFEGNWKLVLEGALENYHLPYCHPQLRSAGREVEWRHDTFGDCAVAFSYRLDDKRPAATAEQQLQPGDLPGSSNWPAHDDRQNFFNLFPSGIFICNRRQVLQNIVLPDGPDRTRYARYVYLYGEAATADGHAEQRKALLEGWKLVGDQDVELVSRVNGLKKQRDAAGIRTRFSPYWEGTVHNFQKLVARSLSTE